MKIYKNVFSSERQTNGSQSQVSLLNALIFNFVHDDNFTIMSNVNYSSMYILIYQNVLQCITNLLYNILESEIWESMKYSINKAKKRIF